MKKEQLNNSAPDTIYQKWMGLKPFNEHISDLNLIKNHLTLHSANIGMEAESKLSDNFFQSKLFKHKTTFLILEAEVLPGNLDGSLYATFHKFTAPQATGSTPAEIRDNLAKLFKHNGVYAVCGDTPAKSKYQMSGLFIPFYLKSREIIKVLNLFFDSSSNPEAPADTFWSFKKPSFEEKSNFEMAALGFGSFIIGNK